MYQFFKRKLQSLRVKQSPKIGIAVIVCNPQGHVLMGIRNKEGPGKGKWQFPGGHLEMYEDLHNCASRETREEAGIEIDNISFLDLSNNPWPHHNKHYVTLFLCARHKSGTPVGVEEYCTEWKWFDLDNLPPNDQLFESITILTPKNKAKIRAI